MQDLIGGRIDYQCALANLAMPQIEGKQAKAIATLSPERSAVMPAIASLKEQGLPDFDASAWNGLFLPKDTPPAIVEKLHAAVVATMDTPSVRDRLQQFGATVVAPDRRSPAYLQNSSRRKSGNGPLRSRPPTSNRSRHGARVVGSARELECIQAADLVGDE